MCRVALMNKKGEKEIERIYGLTRYLKFLEKQFGGHGNGFSLMKNGKIIKPVIRKIQNCRSVCYNDHIKNEGMTMEGYKMKKRIGEDKKAKAGRYN